MNHSIHRCNCLPHVTYNAVNGAVNSFWLRIIVGYDIIEGYIPLLKLFICVSAELQPRWWPDEVQCGMAASNSLEHHIICNAVNVAMNSSSGPL